MTDEGPSSSAVTQDSASETQNGRGESSSSALALGSDGSPRAEWMRRRLLAPFRRKSEFVADLMFKLDLLIYAELVFLYYLE